MGMSKDTKDKKGHLVEVLQGFDVAMLHTKTISGALHGRPMALADVQADGVIYFCATLGSDKVLDIDRDPHVEVSVQGKTKFATLSGTARVTHDRELIHRLWKESWKLWFPNGKDSPEICLIEFDATEGEYWDDGGTRGIKFALQAARAFVKGQRLKEGSADEHAKIRF